MEWMSAAVASVLGLPDPGGVTFTEISTDTRTIRPGALFVALTGPRFDGHVFLEQARDAGARGAVVGIGTPPLEGLIQFEVEDTLVALGQIANARRHLVTGPVVVVTGTNGKTTTKEMLKAVLETTWRVHATRENRNNLVGVPLTILEAPDDAEALVIEAGTSEPGEMARLRRITDPYVGVVTNVAAAHLDGLGTLEGVLTEKVSLLEGAPLAVVGPEPPELATRARAVAGKTIVTGLDVFADVAPDSWSVDHRGLVTLTYRGYSVQLPVVGRHQAANAMIALAVADTIGVDPAKAVRALSQVTLPGGRCELLEVGDLLILNDTYNANPASLMASLAILRDLQYERPVVVVVGSMLELGSQSARAHLDMAHAIVEERPMLIGATGEFVPAFAGLQSELGDRLICADDAEALGRAVGARLRGQEFILLKASRGVKLERAIPFLTSHREDSCSTTS
jgi:UDP-N-acetylmuramoyl-tripeptide--D-alanyl-D-alanine ligase